MVCNSEGQDYINVLGRIAIDHTEEFKFVLANAMNFPVRGSGRASSGMARACRREMWGSGQCGARVGASVPGAFAALSCPAGRLETPLASRQIVEPCPVPFVFAFLNPFPLLACTHDGHPSPDPGLQSQLLRANRHWGCSAGRQSDVTLCFVSSLPCLLHPPAFPRAQDLLDMFQLNGRTDLPTIVIHKTFPSQGLYQMPMTEAGTRRVPPAMYNVGWDKMEAAIRQMIDRCMPEPCPPAGQRVRRAASSGSSGPSCCCGAPTRSRQALGWRRCSASRGGVAQIQEGEAAPAGRPRRGLHG